MVRRPRLLGGYSRGKVAKGFIEQIEKPIGCNQGFPERAVDSYIVHIYRREGKKSRVLIGTVEVAKTEKRTAFSSIEELEEILRRRKRRGEPEKLMLPDPKEHSTS